MSPRTSTVPPARDALVLDPATKKVALESLPTPAPGPGEVLIRVHAVALNPIDPLYATHILATSPRVIGTDFAGVVVAAAPGVQLASGTRVAGFLQGATSINDRPGAFAEYVVSPTDLLWRVPDALPLDAAAAISMCALTAAQGVFDRQGLPAPFPTAAPGSIIASAGETVNYFIYGASTSLGMYAAQMVRAAEAAAGRRFRLIGAASRTNHAMLRAPPYGYDVLVDYRDADWVDQVRVAADGRGVDYAFDAIGEGATPRNVHATLSNADDVRSVVFRAVDAEGLRIKPVYGAVWEALGELVDYGQMVIPVSAEKRAFGVAFYAWLSSAAEDGHVRIQPNPLRRMPGGLAKIPVDAFALLGTMNVSERPEHGRTEEYMRPIRAEKLVYNLVQ